MSLTRPRWQRALLAWIVAFTALTAYAIYQNHKLGVQGKGAHDALCVLKEDLRARVKTSEQYLREHPHGAPGIPASLIKSSLRNQKATLASLAVIDCGLPSLH